MKNKFNILTSRGFIIGLILLLLNDFYFKAEFGNWWTGKISDFSGIFIFTIFLLTVFPSKEKVVLFLTAAFFTFWKSPCSNSLIELFNNINIPVRRVIDYTDLFALFVIPLSYFYLKSDYKKLSLHPAPILFVSLFAFCATSIPPKDIVTYTEINKKYEFDISKRELVNKLNRLAVSELDRLPSSWSISFDSKENRLYPEYMPDEMFTFFIDYSELADSNDTFQYRSALADIVIQGTDSTSSLVLLNAMNLEDYDKNYKYREKVIKRFERKIIRKLKKN